MNDIRPFGFRCYKILPLAYDDSLSYYEVLCKVTGKLNEVISALGEITDNDDEIKALAEKVNENILAINNLEGEYSEIHENLNVLQKDYGETKQLVESLNDIITHLNLNIDAKINHIDAKFTGRIDTLQNDINAELYVIEGEIDKIIDTINKKYAIDVYNYSANRRLSLDRNNTKLYIDLENGISASEYETLNLTAEEYAKYAITALDYIKNASILLHYNWVYMPVSGHRQEISNALTELYNTLQGTMSEAEYETLALTAEQYKDLDLTNTDYRNYNPYKTTGYVQLGGGGLTTKQYASLGVK